MANTPDTRTNLNQIRASVATNYQGHPNPDGQKREDLYYLLRLIESLYAQFDEAVQDQLEQAIKFIKQRNNGRVFIPPHVFKKEIKGGG